MPKISIVIPNYNNAIFLDECLDSASRQTHKDLEIIVVDDKSTDNSVEIIKKHQAKDNRIKLICLSHNQGVSVARNTALEKVSGDFVCFLDSDDFLELNFCEKLYNSIIEKNSDIACGGHVKVNMFHHCISKWLPQKETSSRPRKEIYSFTKHRNVTQKLFKTDIIKKNNIKFEKDLTYMEDAVFLVTYLKYCKLVSGVDESLYNVRINPKSLCRNKELHQRRLEDMDKASDMMGIKSKKV